MPRTEGYRLVVINQNVPNMLAQISTVLSNANLNIIDMINKSRDQIAVTLLDTNQKISAEIISKLENISGVISARVV
jgi:D-3-phosphoglycerate dehydrogenase